MGIVLQRGKSRWWYGRLTINGRQLCQNLGVEVKGVIPAKLEEEGDRAFEESRRKAQTAFDKFEADVEAKQSSEELLQRIHKIRTGKRAGSIPLASMFESWKGIPRKRPLGERYVTQAESWAKRFVEYLKREWRSAQEVADVQSEMAEKFMAAEESRGVSPKTYNNALIFLRSMFGALQRKAGMAENPFAGIPTKVEDTVHRKPFSTEELAAIVEQAKKDKFIGPVILTGICTAMRRGDCCRLRWGNVDLKDRFVSIKTAKTGEFVRIPILPLLVEVLEDAFKARQVGDLYVFPKQATMYQLNPDGITLRAKELFAKAGFHDLEGGELPALGNVSQERPKGLRKASIRDFHSLRVTWVTLALSAGVPMEIVQKVTGHRTAQIVLKHYFQPGKEDYRRTIETKLPALMGGTGAKERLSPEKLAERLKAMNEENWKAVRAEILAGL